MLVSLCESSELVSALLHVCMLYCKCVDVLRVWDMCFGCYSFYELCCEKSYSDSVHFLQIPRHSPQLHKGSTVSTPLNSPLLPQTATKFQLDSLDLLLLVSHLAGLPRT